MLINLNNFVLALCLAISGVASAAVPTAFAPFNDGASIVWSVEPLNKGDVIEVHGFKASPGMIVTLAVCGERCENAHVVRILSIYRPSVNNATERYTLEEDGHLAFWTTRPPQPELNAGGSKAISDDSRNQVAGVTHSGFSGLYTDAEVMQIRKAEIDAERAKVRFDAGCYVTVSRISTAAH
jgi:hypothetical protein